MPRRIGDLGTYTFSCYRCQTTRKFEKTHPSRSKALESLHSEGWASTSMEHTLAKNICPACLRAWVSERGSGAPFMRTACSG